MDGTDQRPLSANDLVGILIHNANQMASHLAVKNLDTDWKAIIAHLGIMYQDAVRAKSMVESAAQSSASAPPN